MAASIAGAGRPWFFGPVPDLLLGCGLLYAGLFAAQSLAGDSLRAALPAGLHPFLTLLFGAPHYGATLLRAYGSRAERRRYALFTVWLTALLVVLFPLGLELPWLGSAIVTLYLTWSPWHYSGQNYGVAMAFLRRRGVPVGSASRRLLHLSFVTSFALTFLALHGAGPAETFAPATHRGTVFELYRLGIPAPISAPLFRATLAVYLLSATLGAAGLLRASGLRRPLPALLLLLTQALWFGLPTSARHFGLFGELDPLSAKHASYTLMWVAVGHFLQYLWFTTFYACGASEPRVRLRYLGECLLLGAALWTLPTLLFAPGGLGRLPFDFGLGLLAAALVNLHHFALDGAIWKLRDGRVARVLVREPVPEPEVEPRRPWLRPVLLLAGAFSLAVTGLAYTEAEFGFRRAAERMDLPRLRRAVDRLAWLGRDSPRAHLALARVALGAGDAARARRELERSLELHPTAEALIELANWHERFGSPAEASAALERAVALDPDHSRAQYRLGVRRLRSGDPKGAVDALERAAELEPGSTLIRKALDRAREELAEPAGPAGRKGAGPEPAAGSTRREPARPPPHVATRGAD